ncbi:hypothetical protein ACKLNR_006043 [Fusarium oxysporum f. sp. zingiberi]
MPLTQNHNAEDSCLKNHPTKANDPEKDVSHLPPSINSPSSQDRLPENLTDGAADDYPEGGLTAWLVVFGSWSAMVSIYGLINTSAVFESYFKANQLKDYSYSQIGWIFSLYLFLVFLVGVLVGPVFDRFGPRLLVAGGCLLIVLGLMLLSLCKAFYQTILTYSVLGGLGGALLNAPAYSAIAHFFHARRGLATGVASTAGGIGGTVFPLLLRHLLGEDGVGFAWSCRIMGFIMLGLAVPANLFIKSRESVKTIYTGQTKDSSLWPDFGIFREPRFALASLGYFFMEIGLFAPLTYIISYATTHGMSTPDSFLLLSFLNAGSVVGRFLPGLLADMFGRFNVIIVTIALCVVTVLGIWLPCNGSRRVLITFAVTFGVASGSNLSLIPVCLGQFCESRHYGRYFATATMFASFGTLISVPIAGTLLDVGNESTGWTALILFSGCSYLTALNYSSDTEDASYIDIASFVAAPPKLQAFPDFSTSSSLSSIPSAPATTNQPCVHCFGRGTSDQLAQQPQDTHDPILVIAQWGEPEYRLALDPQLQHSSTVGPNPQHPVPEPCLDFDPVGNLSTSLRNAPEELGVPVPTAIPAKIGNRFSRVSLQILRRWLALHSRYPYPSKEEKELLQRQTGLSMTQISNWLTNSRRKRKAQPETNPIPSTSRTQTGPVDIIRRPGTPAVHINTDPLQRWVDSPPESEPASVDAIARAVTSSWDSRSRTSRHYRPVLSDEDSEYSLDIGTSASSAGTSSGSSFASGHSHRSGSSFRSVGNINKPRSNRRRRRRVIPERRTRTLLVNPQKLYQCTFCAEAFKTKHDWQRHEKSLHISLDKWVCTPHGSRVANPRTGQLCCVFCGRVDPDEAHLEGHNHRACTGRQAEDKSFYRKDHINQHLKLVHDAQFLDWSMKSWKLATLEVRSRCGFCGIVMHSWSARVEHLAEHFKNGSTMADWKGDWGFDTHVIDMLESAIPPYLIDMERNSPFPFTAKSAPADSPRSAYELITLELAYFVANYKQDTGYMPSDAEMQLEACRIIFASEVSSQRGISTESSWLRDLLMGDKEIAKYAQFAPLRQGAENRLCALKINGKDNIFEQCPLELQLREFGKAKTVYGRSVNDEELQEQCCSLIGGIEEMLISHSDFTTDWLIRLAMSSTTWLTDFRRRAHFSRIQVAGGSVSRSGESSMARIGMFDDEEIGQPLNGHAARGFGWSDELLETETPEDTYSPVGLRDITTDGSFKSAALEHYRTEEGVPTTTPQGTQQEKSGEIGSTTPSRRRPGAFEDRMKKTFFMNDSNCYRRLAQELTRFVMSTMSRNNPNRHVPSDVEIQHQARWILFEK